VRSLILLFSLFSAVSADAVPPAPVQTTANCEAPSYASDTLTCEDAGLRELDTLLALRIAHRNATLSSTTDDEMDQDWFQRSRLCAFEADHRACLLAAYCFRLAAIDDSDRMKHTECDEPPVGYIPVSAISESGFARDKLYVETLSGSEIGLWGFFDQQNIYGDDRAKDVLGDWWSGYGPDPSTWQFNLKANQDDGAGHSFPVRVSNDMLRDDLLRVFLQDARSGRSTKVYLRGRISTYPAPLNASTRYGLSMVLQSTWDVRLGPVLQR